MNWTRDDMPLLEGKTAVVTGANSGLGYQVSLALAMKGTQVIMACRNRGRGEAARQRILAQNPPVQPELWDLDLARLSSVRTFAEAYLSKHRGPDLLINNAGVMAIPYARTEDGFEMQFGVNHLGHFALTSLLWKGLQQADHGRIIHVSSLAHHFGKIRFWDINWEGKYSRWGAYGMSKLANLLFNRELSRRLKSGRSGILSLSAHPGYADTSLITNSLILRGSRWKEAAMGVINRNIAQTGEMGSLPVLYAATASGVEQGGFYGPSGLLRMKGSPVKQNPHPGKVNDIVARQLWELSENLTGHEFNPG
jgi:NAD(P)-dependent dehydrogenase (short-subunit alcohol dehydrogenase family)